MARPGWVRTSIGRGWAPATLARFAFYGWRCVYCGRDLSCWRPAHGRGAMPTRDHRLSAGERRWRGLTGPLDVPANIVPACLACNASKHYEPRPLHFREAVA